MLHTIVRQKKNAWLQTPDCPVTPLLAYIRGRGELRPPQVEAIETYLFLKMEGQNKPLGQLFEDGFFHTDLDLDSLPLSTAARAYLGSHAAARSLFEFARQTAAGTSQPLLPELVKQIQEQPESVPYAAVIGQLFYDTPYPDYLFSLPMGAGKTFLMAAFMYLDLYFALDAPDDPRFAHNFLVLIPNGLKTSLVPSLRTIQHFDPAWVIPPPAADYLRDLLRLEVLDEAKSAKKSNKARNPNAQRVNQHLADPGLMGLVLVVNAEKVVLDRLPDDPDQLELIEKSADERDQQANELRSLIGKLPHLALHIDEVHHAAKDDVLLRKIVTGWQQRGNITAVLGYTGTPYLKTPDKLAVAPGLTLRLTQISNTVYYYPLLEAVRLFLKKPVIKIARQLSSLDIIRQGVREFEATYGRTEYANGTTAKMAIYCSSIERLEEEVFPLLTGELGIAPAAILKFHQGKAATKATASQPARPAYPLAAEARRDFALLDHPLSRKRYVLLVQIGKEGWDCRSLTGVVLAQQGDSPPNMVLQTSCRCLRQVVRGHTETALIWLNEGNATLLNKQLADEQHTSIEELNAARPGAAPAVPRRSRVAHLQLPTLAFYQLRLQHDEQLPDQQPDPALALTALLAGLRQPPYFRQATVETRALAASGGGTAATLATAAPTHYVQALGRTATSLLGWLREITRESFGTLALTALQPYHPQLQALFAAITTAPAPDAAADALPVLNEIFDLDTVRAAVRLAFAPLRELRQHTETIQQHAQLLLAEKLADVPAHPHLYPPAALTAEILRFDQSGRSMAELEAQRLAANERLRAEFRPDPADFFAAQTPDQHRPFPFVVQRKDRSFHYLPYDFRKSGFEQAFLEGILQLPDLDTHDLEVYFNGEGHLTEFRIRCYARPTPGGPWRYVGRYTPDFLVVQRNAAGELHRVLILETKGAGFADQPAFQQRKTFVEGEFLRLNHEKFGYHRFDFLYLPDSTPLPDLLGQLQGRIHAFFV